MSYAGLSLETIQARMNERFATGTAYVDTVLWDEIRAQEMIQTFNELVGPVDGARILDVGVGRGGAARELWQRGAFASYLGIDLSSEALAQAATNNADIPRLTYTVMNASALDVPSASIDLIYAREIIEHLTEQEAMLAECARVLAPGGRMILSSPNRDSLHLRMNRMLGHEDFQCCLDHIHELTFKECRTMIHQAGLEMVKARGVFLMPYWGISGVDGYVRALTDNDPAVIEWCRVMGQRVGPEYAFQYVIHAEKP